MTTAIITAENLGKRYKLRHEAQVPYQTLREALTAKARRVFSAGGPDAHMATQEDFWALRDINFEIQRGDVVGIIGRNGAGKSTLLKILSRITEPTTGRIRLRGRVASLLEVGTGFHPELTGRENIFLNGSILGMSKGEIRRNFDEIVSFAEVEKFLDTPVKHYSSGMYVRLAFAVAAHLNPEILVVDEVLAVGDSLFQKKCLGKMKDVAEHSGRTVLFVSHNMAAVEHLCNSAIMLTDGRVHTCGPTRDVLDAYRASTKDTIPTINKNSLKRPAWARPVISGTTLMNQAGTATESFGIGDLLRIKVNFKSSATAPVSVPCLGIVISNSNSAVAAVNMRMTGSLEVRQLVAGSIICDLAEMRLAPGNYSIDLWLGDGNVDIDMVEACLSFEIESTDFYGSGVPPFSHLGATVLTPKWTVLSEAAQNIPNA